MNNSEKDCYTRHDGSKCENKFIYVPITIHDQLYELKRHLEDNIRYILDGKCKTTKEQQESNDMVEYELKVLQEISDSIMYSICDDDCCIVSTKHMWMLERMLPSVLLEDK